MATYSEVGVMLGLSSLLLQEIERRGWSMRDLAAESGVSSSTLSNITTKPDVMPDLRTLSALSSALELPMRQLVEACGIPVEGAVADSKDRISALIGAVPELQQFLNLLGQLTPDDRDSVLTYTEMLVQRRQKTA
jgi:transcriptional regulator with XRE-family HTH domain